MGIMFTMPQASEESIRDQKIELIKPAAENAQKRRNRSVQIIVAIGPEREIGVDGDMIWHISEDLKRFKLLTGGHPVVMGRKTWQSLPRRPLPGRRNIVISRNADFHDDGAEVFPSLEEALQAAFECSDSAPFVIGGGQIYQQALKYSDTLHITQILAKCEQSADTFFPDFNKEGEWELAEAGPQLISAKESIPFRYETWRRKEH